MQITTLAQASELVSHAAYDESERMLYLTYRGGRTTIAYQDVPPQTYAELEAASYPDLIIRFAVQARHPFRRVEAPFQVLERTFVK